MAHRIDKKQAAREARLRAEEEARRALQRAKVMRGAGAGIVAASRWCSSSWQSH